ncbi:hypothetical protein TraAM80_05910 [Trypanosoma rangeli]|uniref:Kinetoplast ribosomal PPR-repeat containing protein 3 n=1 Tax=Trypanosoma rangeli TaxID=5698 RepID=A0A3R7K7U1_TRYRA|nr:uncharacterized protein TraAM80_05910 [Trypanosoma rangeli]RNF03176.1 hypothetical protein TraAM80_05910 [Trypanosoma rangeli]|eukprot:RNF03176.1 hypothetical protein TraAM80_05910 [Trypanosoma rangeli]
MRRAGPSACGRLFFDALAGIRSSGHASSMQHRCALLPPVDRIGGAGETSLPRTPYRFAVKDEERGLYDHGLTPDARLLMAEAEAQYKASADYLHAPPGGLAPAELHLDADGETVSCIAAPFAEEYVPSHKERYAHRGHVGELSMQRVAEPKFLLNAHAELNLRKERQLCEVMSSPMPSLQKAGEVERLLYDFYLQQFAVSSRNVEAIIALWAQCSVEERLAGHAQVPQLTSSTTAGGSRVDSVAAVDAVPFLPAMKRLYFHARQTHVAPTPLVLECLMTTLAAASSPDSRVFHFSNRLLLDADKYVVLPTRTTYAAFFAICSLHNAMSFAVVRFKDAVVSLHVAVDATMATALLKGLCQNGLVEEALALLARIEHVPLDVQLLNATIEVLLLSPQPQACFSAFDATQSCSVRPNAETYSLLLLACERSGLWCRTTAILADMQRRRVKGDTKTLNLLLKGLLTERLHDYARQLYDTMVTKKVEVWPALESHMRLPGKHKSRRRPQQPSRPDSPARTSEPC